MVEIFKTNVKNKKLAEKVLKTLRDNLPAYNFNFDLEDCDRILRVQSAGNKMETADIMQTAKVHRIEISLIEG